jgi:hypothetical protein
MNFNGTLRAFQNVLPVDIYDVTGSYQHGVWEWGQEVKRANGISGIILSMDKETLSFFGEGYVTLGGIVIHTQGVLYFTDIEVSDEQNKQSFVVWQRYRFKVVGTGLMSNPVTLSGNANFSVYYCLRSVR